MKKKDLNEIAKIEKAIKEKYGEDAIKNPKGSWCKEKEEKYLKDLKEFYKHNKTKKRLEEKDGFTIKASRDRQSLRVCPVCNSYSFNGNDDLYMTKFGCRFNCYVEFVEGREERWKSGWRPNN